MEQLTAAEARTKRLYATTDGGVWASEFMAVVESGADVDWGLMVGWFANAIETGCAHERARSPERLIPRGEAEVQHERWLPWRRRVRR